MYSLQPVLFGVTGQKGLDVLCNGVTWAKPQNTAQNESLRQKEADRIEELTRGRHVVHAKNFVLCSPLIF